MRAVRSCGNPDGAISLRPQHFDVRARISRSGPDAKCCILKSIPNCVREQDVAK